MTIPSRAFEDQVEGLQLCEVTLHLVTGGEVAPDRVEQVEVEHEQPPRPGRELPARSERGTLIATASAMRKRRAGCCRPFA